MQLSCVLLEVAPVFMHLVLRAELFAVGGRLVLPCGRGACRVAHMERKRITATVKSVEGRYMVTVEGYGGPKFTKESLFDNLLEVDRWVFGFADTCGVKNVSIVDINGEPL